MRRVRIADNLVIRRRPRRVGRQRHLHADRGGPSEIIVEHNTIMQTGNVLTVYGGSRDAPSAGERFVFRNNITPHNANGVIGQGLGVGSDSIDAFFPGAVFLRNVLAGGRGLALSG